MIRKALILSLVMLVLTAGTAVFAQQNDVIMLKSRQFTPALQTAPMLELSKFAGRHALVQLSYIPTAEQRAELADNGVQLLRYISGGAWLASVDDLDFDEFKGTIPVRWVGELTPSDKISAQIKDGLFLPHAELSDGRHAFDIGMHMDIPEAAGRRLIENLGGVVLDYASITNSFIISLDREKVIDIAARDEVSWVGEAGVALRSLNDKATEVTGGDQAGQAPYSVTGKGVTAFVLDGGTISTGTNAHPDLGDRVFIASGGNSTDLVGHPSHVGCTVGGDGTASNGQYAGMAPEVEILSSSVIPGITFPPMYDKPGNIESAYQRAVEDFGATVSNNSIGSNIAQFGTLYCDKEGDYERTAQLVDGIMAGAFGNITIVWANGNERGNNDGACGNAYGTTAPPATSKNPIAVGAVQKDGLGMTPFSSWGPVDDGRLRPDVSAPGCSQNGDGIVSCAAGLFGLGRKYVGLCGTSMAAPVVTGGVALIQEYWRKKISNNDAMPATYKALVIHGSSEVGDPGPDYVFGYGILDVPATLDLIDQAFIVEDSVDQGETFSVSLDTTGGPVKATLVWSDVPGERLAARVLVNDLDLTVDDGSSVYLPYVLDPANPAEPATTGTNTLDPTEQVAFTASSTKGMVEIIVTGTEVPDGPQNFSLVVSGVVIPSTGDDDDNGPVDDDDDDGDDDDDAVQADDDDDDDDDGGCGC